MKISTRASAKLSPSFRVRTGQAAQTAARVVFPELFSAFGDAIGSPVWSWPRVTIRQGSLRRDGTRTAGFAVGSPRNIVDRGLLRQSGSFQVTGSACTFRWAVGYATAVHYGARIHPWGDRDRPTVLLPARPWTDAVLGNLLIPGIEAYDYREQFRVAFISAWRRL
jgi:hypothetical protein